LKQWTGEEAESAEWVRELFRDTHRKARGQADYWANPELASVLARKDRDGWTADWADQYRAADAPAYGDVETFLDGSRAKERVRRRNRLLLYSGSVLLILTTGIAILQSYRVRTAQALSNLAQAEVELARAEIEVAKARIEALQLQLPLAQSAGDRERIQNDINALQAQVLQGENTNLQNEIKRLTAQTQQTSENQDLSKVIEAQKARLDVVLPKADTYDALQKKFGDPETRLAQTDLIEKERNDLRAERDRLKLALANAERQPVNQQPPPPGAISVEVPKNSAVRVANLGLTFFADWKIFASDVYILSGTAPITEPFLNDEKKSRNLNERV
jgi:hypothetical protein